MRDMNLNALEMIFQTGDEMLGSIYGDGEYRIKNFPRFSGEYKSVDYEILKDEFECAMLRAMEHHQNKKIGVLLSGGLDSTLTLYILKLLWPDADITAYNSYWLNDPASDERRFAQMAADATYTPLKIVGSSAEIDNEALPEMVRACDSIRDGAIWAYGMCKVMAEDGVEVVVNSMGPDSLLGNCGIQHRWYDKRKLRIFPVVNTKYKYLRYASILFGTDKAFFINSIAINPGKRYVEGSTLDWNEWYADYFQDNLWITMIKWLMEIVLVNKTVLFDPICEYFGMEAVFPYLDNLLLEHCIHLEPDEVYNKIPLRNMMENYYGVPTDICNRGRGWDYGPTGKMGGGPTISSGYFTKDYYQKLLFDHKFSFTLPLKMWAIKESQEWLDTGNRRIRHLGYLIWQMREELNERVQNL